MTSPDFFLARLDAMIDLRHPLAVLGTRMPWAQIECKRSATPSSPCSPNSVFVSTPNGVDTYLAGPEQSARPFPGAG